MPFSEYSERGKLYKPKLNTMKKLLLTISLVLFAAPMWAQIVEKYVDYEKYGKGKMPFSDNGEVVFTKVVPVEGKTKLQLYSAARLLMVDGYEVKLEDKDNYIIVARGSVEAPIPKGFSIANPVFMNARIHYTLRIQCKDNRYKTTVYSIVGEMPAQSIAGIQMDAKYITANDLTDAKCVNADGTIKQEGSFWRMSIIDASELLPTAIHLSMTQALAVIDPSEDW